MAEKCVNYVEASAAPAAVCVSVSLSVCERLCVCVRAVVVCVTSKLKNVAHCKNGEE